MVNFGRILFSSLLEMNRAWSTADGYRCQLQKMQTVVYICTHIRVLGNKKWHHQQRDYSILQRDAVFVALGLGKTGNLWPNISLPPCYYVALHVVTEYVHTHSLISIQCKTATNTEERQHLSHHLFSSQHRLQVYTCCKVLILNNTYYIVNFILYYTIISLAYGVCSRELLV